MKNRVPQKETIFYRLYQDFRDKTRKNAYRPIFEFMGEVWIEVVGKWGFMSYELPARFAELKQKNPELIQRVQVRGKSGAKYYAYRLNPRAKQEMILDPDLFNFYQKIKAHHDKTKPIA